MGQRHQYIIVYPEKKYLGDNPNNEPERAEVLHHQWLYGRSALLALDRVLRLIKNVDINDDCFFNRGKNQDLGDGTAAIAAAVSVDLDLGYFHNVWPWENKEVRAPQDYDPEEFHNNDGITLIKFERGNPLPKYAFITPGHLEGSYWKQTAGRGPWSADQYLKFYYSHDDTKTWPVDVLRKMGSIIHNISNNATLLTKDEVKKLLPKFYR